MDAILLNKLIFMGTLGVTEEERSKLQRIKVSVRINLNLAEAAQTDRIEQALNYTIARKEVQFIVENQTFNLVEALANTINMRLLGLFRNIDSVTTIITKLDIRGAPTVIMHRNKKAA